MEYFYYDIPEWFDQSSDFQTALYFNDEYSLKEKEIFVERLNFVKNNTITFEVIK